MEIFKRNRFIIQHNLKDFKDTDGIMDTGMNPLCYVKRQQSWKSMVLPWVAKIPVLNMLWQIPSRQQQMETTDIQLRAVDGTPLGEIHETPVFQWVRMIRKWQVYDAKGEYKGAVKEKPKAVGSDWVLESVEGMVIATSEGDRKKHDCQVLALDKQVSARCQPEEAVSEEDSYGVDILRSDSDPLLVLSYISVLAHVSAWRVERRRDPSFGYTGR